jgi:hypothetical protein
VELNVRDLPPPHRQKAEKYAQSALENIRGRVSDFPDLDASRGMHLEIRPEAFLWINVMGYDQNGGYVGF